MADNLTTGLDNYEKTLDRISEKVAKLQNELNTKTNRITPELLGEQDLEEEDRTLTKLNETLKEYANELNRIKSISVNTNNVDALTSRLNRLGGQIVNTKEQLKELYSIAANNVVNEFDTSSGFGKKAELNANVRSVLDSAGYTSETNKQINELYDNLVKKYGEKISEKDFGKKFEGEVDKLLGDSVNLVNKHFVDGIFKGVDTDTLGIAINEAMKTKGSKIADAIKTNDQLEKLMGDFTRTGIREDMLVNNPEGLLFGNNYTSGSIKELEDEIKNAEEVLKQHFPQGEKTSPDGRAYYNQDEVKYAYKEEVQAIERMKTALDNSIKSVESSGGYLSMYERLQNASNTLVKPMEIANNLQFAQLEGKSVGDYIKEAYEIKLDPTNTDIIAKKIDEETVAGFKSSIEKLSNTEALKGLSKTSEITGDSNIDNLKNKINSINEEYNSLRNNIKNTSTEVNSTGAVFDANQISSYENELDKIIADGNQLRETMVSNYNDINSSFISNIKNIEVEWKDFVNKATSEIRFHITNDESVDKIRLIDGIMNDIKQKANDFEIFDNTDAKVLNTIQNQLTGLKNQKEQFGKSDKQFVVNDIEIQKLQIALDIIKRLKEQTSNVRSEDYNVGTTQRLSKMSNDINEKINRLKEVNDKISEGAKSLGIKIEDVPSVKYSSRVASSVYDFIDKQRDTSLKYEKEHYNSNISRFAGDNRALAIENHRHETVINNIKKEAEEQKKIYKYADTDYTNEIKRAAKDKADAEKRHQQELDNTKRKIDELRDKVNETVQIVKQSIANVIKVIRVANSVIDKSIQLFVGVFSNIGSAVERILKLFGNFGNRLGIINNHGNILKGTFTELKSKIDLLVGAFNKLFNNSFINEGKQLLSSIQTMNMLIGTELTAQTMEWAKTLEDAFGLSASGLIADLKELTAVMYGLGMTSNDVQIAATNLEAVAMSLSATTGYDFSTVINKIQSGMKGMTQSIDDLGLSVRESQMDDFLKKLKAQGGEYANIGTHFSQLTEQQRIYVRYAAIMDQFTSKEAYSAENYAKSLRTITGSISVLNSQLRGLKSDVGALALQLFAKIVQPLIYIIYLIRQAVKWLANLLNIDISLNPNINGGETDKATQSVDDMTDSLEKEADAADKAKASLDGWDHVTSMSTNKSSSSGDDPFDYSSLMDASGDFAGALAEMAKSMDKFIDDCKRKLWFMLYTLRNRFIKWVKDVTGRIVDWNTIQRNLKFLVDNLKGIATNILRIGKAAFDLVGGLIYSIFDDLNATSLFAKVTKVFERVTYLIALALEKIRQPIMNMYNKYISPYVVKAGEKIREHLNKAIVKLQEWIDWFGDPSNSKTINDFFDNIGKKIKGVIMVMEAFFQGSDRKLGDNEVGFLDQDGMEGFKEAYNIAGLMHNVIAQILVIMKELWDVVKGVIQEVLDFNNNGELDSGDLRVAIAFIKDKLDDIAIWISNNKEEIISLLSNAVETAGVLANAKFDIIMNLLKFITDHADLINAILDALKELIKFAAEHPVITITAAVGVQVGGQIIKTAITAAMWKKLLGIGAAETAGQSIGAKIAAGISSKLNGTALGGLLGKAGGALGTGAAVGAELGGVAGWGTATVMSAKEAGYRIRDSFQDTFGLVNFTNEAGETLRIGAKDTKRYAYEIRQALEETYGKDFDTSKISNAVELYTQIIKNQTGITEAETEKLRQNIESQYYRIGNALDTSAAKWAYASDNSDKNIKNLSKGLAMVDGEVAISSKDIANNSELMAAKAGKSYNDLDSSVKKTDKETSKSFTSIASKALSLGSTITKASVGSNVPLVRMANQFKFLEHSINGTLNSITSRINTFVSDTNTKMSSINLNAGADIRFKTSAGVGKVLGFANGGIPTSGSLFIANENGNTELVGNFGGYSGAANQGMVTKAIYDAVYNAVKSAGGVGGSGEVINNYNIGNWLGDAAGIRQLANLLNNVNTSSRSNIANTAFVMR